MKKYQYYIWNLKYNRIDMKKKSSQIVLRPTRKMLSSTKQLPTQSTASDSLKAPKKKPTRKNRKFGDDITNLGKQPVSQNMQIEEPEQKLNEIRNKMSQIEPYLCQIENHLATLDDQFNFGVLEQLMTKNSQSTQITLDMRKILVKWIVQVAEKFKANHQTVHISIQIIDYILVFSHEKITKSNFQLLGISALFVASKYNEIYTPEAKKYVYVCDGLYTLDDLFQMQGYILNLSGFNLQFPTVYNFIGPYINNPNTDEEFKKTLQNVSKIVILDFNLFNKYKKMHLTGVIVYFCAKISNMQIYSSKEMMQQLKIDQQIFKNCFGTLLNLYKQTFKPNVSSQQNKE